MDVRLAELAVLYEISSFGFSGSEGEFFRELVAKAVRLFGVRRVALVLFEESARPACYAWGFPERFLQEQGGLLDYIHRNQCSPGGYVRDLEKKGAPALLFLEKKREFTDRERRLLDILAGRVAELLHGYFREKRLVYLSTHDPLTGLYNRVFFEEELDRLEKGRSFPVSIIVCDLDGLKVANDVLGHKQGDELLRRAAQVIAGCVRGSDVVARVGGDEFAVILPQADRKVAEEVVERITESVERDNAQHPDLPLSVSVGAATAEDASRPLREVYAEADDAMYRDKLAREADPHRAVVRVLKAALAVKDYVAQGHTERVKKLACMLGEAVGLTRSDLDTLRLLADIHDVGKLGVPEHILFKPSPLTREEWEEVRRHPEVGYRLALSSPELAPVAELIRQHHERWDGKGYPRGLRGEEIHVLSRILAIADAYDAMTSERPYRPALSREEALEELKRCAGTQFDPHLVEVFVKLLDEKREGRAERRASLRPDALPQGRSPQ
jgi:diguanylate cyclase (GGDEF)-like protein